MPIKEALIREFIRNGYAKQGRKKVWDIADRKFLYLTPELAKRFLQLRNLRFYKQQVIDREKALIRANGLTLKKAMGKEPFNLIDVYCGDGEKAIEFIKTVSEDIKIRYCPVNVNDYLIKLAIRNVRKEKMPFVKASQIKHCDCDGEELSRLISELRNSTYQRNVILLFGSVIASYDINDYLFHVSRNMLPDDVLIIGNAIRKGPRLVNLDLYKDKVWDQWFSQLLKELGFNDSEFEYDARFGNSRVEAYYTLKNDKKIRHHGKEVDFKKGDEILAATLHKFYPKELQKFCKMYFSDVKLMKDKDSEYALVVCKR